MYRRVLGLSHENCKLPILDVVTPFKSTPDALNVIRAICKLAIRLCIGHLFDWLDFIDMQHMISSIDRKFGALHTEQFWRQPSSDGKEHKCSKCSQTVF